MGTLTTMKIDTFVPNYIEEYNPFKVSRNILLKTSHLLWATSLLWGMKWEGNQLLSIETVQHNKEELNFGPLVCQLKDSHAAPHQFKSPIHTLKIYSFFHSKTGLGVLSSVPGLSAGQSSVGLLSKSSAPPWSSVAASASSSWLGSLSPCFMTSGAT